MKKLTLFMWVLVMAISLVLSLASCGNEAHDHAFTIANTDEAYLKSAATCSDAAIYYYSCICGEKSTETFDHGNALEHTWGSATCETPKTCSVCGTAEGDKLPHSFVGGLCTECGEKDPNYVEPHIHSYDKGVVTSPTCTDKGYTTYTCSCGHSYTADETVPSDHVLEILPAVAPDCKNSGLTEGVKCSKCDSVLLAQTVIDPIDHVLEILPAVAPDCKNSGLTAGVKCTKCDSVLLSQTVIDPIDHVTKILPAVAPDCDNSGLTEGKMCSECGTTLLAQVVVPPFGHTYSGYTCIRCGAPDPNAPDSKMRYDVPSEGYDGSAVTITFYHTMGQKLQAELNNAIERFNEIYPNIIIEHTQVGGYDDVRDFISHELVAGIQPNLAYCYPDHVALYNLTGKVVPLDNFIESTIADSLGGCVLGLTQTQIDNFIDAYYAEGTAFDEAGTMYTLPMSKSTEVLYYNKTFFDANGIKVPTTWDELEAVCAQIKAIDPDCIPFGYDSEANWFITMAEQSGSGYTSNGENKFLFNNKTNREFVGRFREWFDKGYFTTQEIYGSYTSNLFGEQGCYMCIGSSAGAAHQVPAVTDGVPAFEVGIAPIPQVDPAKPKAITQGPSLCIFDQENKQEVVASWLFVKFLTTDAEFQASFSMASGYIPVIEREVLAAALPSYENWLNTGSVDPDKEADYSAKVISTTVKEALLQKDSYFVIPAFNGSAEARDNVGALMQYCFVTPATDIPDMIEQAFKDSVKDCVENS